MTFPNPSKHPAMGIAPGQPPERSREPRRERGEGHHALNDDRVRGQAAGEGRELEGDYPIAVGSPPGPQRVREQVLPGRILVERHRVAGEAAEARIGVRGRLTR